MLTPGWQSSDPLAAFGVHDAEEVSLGVGEHHEVDALGVLPIHALSAKRQQSLDFGLLLLFAAHVQVKMSSVGLVQQEGRACATLRYKSALVTAGTGHVAQGAAPEGCRPAEVGDVQYH